MRYILHWLISGVGLIAALIAALVPGFRVLSFDPAFFGSILLTIVDWLLSWLLHA